LIYYALIFKNPVTPKVTVDYLNLLTYYEVSGGFTQQEGI